MDHPRHWQTALLSNFLKLTTRWYTSLICTKWPPYGALPWLFFCPNWSPGGITLKIAWTGHQMSFWSNLHKLITRWHPSQIFPGCSFFLLFHPLQRQVNSLSRLCKWNVRIDLTSSRKVKMVWFEWHLHTAQWHLSLILMVSMFAGWFDLDVLNHATILLLPILTSCRSSPGGIIFAPPPRLESRLAAVQTSTGV